MKVIYIAQLHGSCLVEEHNHDYWEVVYYTQGNGFVNIEGVDIPFIGGDIFVIPPFVSHFDYSDKVFSNYHLNFDDTDRAFDTSFHLKLHDTDDGVFAKILALIYNEYYRKREKVNIIEPLFEVLQTFLTSACEFEPENLYISKIKNELIANISNCEFKIDQAFEGIPLNTDYLRKMFARKTGQSPRQYLISLRLNLAKEALEKRFKTRLTLKEIAFMSGYSEYYYFSRSFKKHFGVSPNHWTADSDDRNKISCRRRKCNETKLESKDG